MHDLPEMRRPDFLFAFCDQDKIDRHFLARSFHRVERGEEGRLRSLLVDRSTADHDFSQPGLVNDGGVSRRR